MSEKGCQIESAFFVVWGTAGGLNLVSWFKMVDMGQWCPIFCHFTEQNPMGIIWGIHVRITSIFIVFITFTCKCYNVVGGASQASKLISYHCSIKVGLCSLDYQRKRESYTPGVKMDGELKIPFRQEMGVWIKAFFSCKAHLFPAKTLRGQPFLFPPLLVLFFS